MNKMPFDNFNCGLVFGVLAAGVMAIILAEIREARGQMGQQHRTFDSYSDAERPHLTSAKVVWSSFFGTLSCAFWTAVLILAVIALVRFAVYIRDLKF